MTAIEEHTHIISGCTTSGQAAYRMTSNSADPRTAASS
jgi:hypothetical protein